jgi:predicted RNA-binding Zn ribbon-like protein
VTSQIYLDSYIDAGVLTAMAFANDLLREDVDAHEAAARILSFDPLSLSLLKKKHGSALVALARRLRRVFEQLDAADVDSAAVEINRMLELHPAHPHLAKEDGVWRLHHHPGDAELVPMYTSICAEGLARMISGGYASRFGVCEADGCDTVFFDNSKNATRRFCSVTCQNRVKTAAFRTRQQSLMRRKR